MQIIFNFETWVATLPPVKSPLPKKNSMQAAGVSLQQFHTCPPPPLREGRVSQLIALLLSVCAPVCQQSECGAERSVTHWQTVQRHRGSPRDFRDSRSGWTQRRGKHGAPWNGVKCGICVLLPIKGDGPICDLIRDSVLHLFSGNWLITRERLIDYDLEETFHFTSTCVESKPPTGTLIEHHPHLRALRAFAFVVQLVCY